VLWASPVWATTYTAATCGSTDVQTAMNSATGAGDIVQIPAGTCSWTTQVAWTAPANASLLGAGTTATGGGDVTIISDNSPTNVPTLHITASATGTFTMAKLTVRSGVSGVVKDDGIIYMNAASGTAQVAIHHMHLDTLTQPPPAAEQIMHLDGLRGVMYQSVFDLSGLCGIYPFNSGSDGIANDIWAAATGFGTSDFFFIEDNVITGNYFTIGGTPVYGSRLVDVFWGGKIVIRFNSFNYASGYEVHATGSWGNARGARAVELYGNTFVRGTAPGSQPNRTMADMSSGTHLAWGNVQTGAAAFINVYLSHVTRANNDTYNQSAFPGGWGYCGTTFNGTGSGWDQSSSSPTGYACLDQPGRGVGDVLSGNFPSKINATLGSAIWPRNALEPLYMWNNDERFESGWGGSGIFNDGTGGRLTANVDYYRQASGVQVSASSPFSGTTGTGWGTLTNRPTTCTTGVGYFATDQGAWNGSTTNPYGVQQNGADGVFYLCSSTNTWTLYYTPYTYPHPLQGATVPTQGGARFRVRY
jgi:hypothetical protein